MADTYTDGYIRGFAVMGRDLSKKKTVLIRYPLGFERMIRQAVQNFEAHGLSVIFMRAAVDLSLIHISAGGSMSTKTRERGAADIPAMYMAVIPMCS